jgi:spermidine/putrescine transport system permease protein
MGFSGLRVFFEVTAPLIKNALVSAVLFCFVLSFNEFVMSYFLCTPDIMTLPINIWSLLRTGFSPIVAASSTVVILITLGELVLISRFVGFQTLYK